MTKAPSTYTERRDRDPATGINKLFVYIREVDDGESEAQSVREMIKDEAPPHPDRQPPEAARDCRPAAR